MNRGHIVALFNSLALALLLGISFVVLAASPPVFTAAQVKADFAQLYQDLQTAHFDLFANVSREHYNKHYEDFYQGIHSEMTEAEVRVYFQRFMALGNIAHANISLPVADFEEFRQQGGKALPLYVRIDEDRVYVSNLYVPELGIEQGQQILAINSRPINDWLSDMAAMLSADNERLRHTLIEAQWPFLLWLLKGEEDEFKISVDSAQGVTEIAVPTLSREQQQQYAAQHSTGDTEPDRDAYMLAQGIAYLKPGPFFNIAPGAENIWDNTAFRQFIDNAFASFIQQQAKALLIDLRQNPGGTNAFSDAMLAWFADKPFKFASDFVVKVSEHSKRANQQRLQISGDNDEISQQLASFYRQNKNGERFSFALPLNPIKAGNRFDKPVYLLIDRYTYSNAVSVAAIVQDYGFGVVMGEKTADLATTFGAMEQFVLEHSSIKVNYPKALIVRPNGDTQPDGVTPDITLPISKTATTQQAIEIARQRIVAELDHKTKRLN